MNLVVFLGSNNGDDSAGYECYKKAISRINARMLFLGTDIFEILRKYENEKIVIVVDAFYGANDVIHLKNEEIFNFTSRSEHAHYISPIEAIKILKEAGFLPEELHLIGIPAKSFEKVTYTDEMIERAIKIVEELLK
ncbi:MAG: hydrogenase maturation protease [Candidatus Thermoplasmatota archaeon]